MEMLSIKTIRDLEYYLQKLMEDYYLGPAMTGKEPPGQWTGQMAAGLGLSGVVDPDVLRAMWRGTGPGGEVLRKNAGYALPGLAAADPARRRARPWRACTTLLTSGLAFISSVWIGYSICRWPLPARTSPSGVTSSTLASVTSSNDPEAFIQTPRLSGSRMDA